MKTRVLLGLALVLAVAVVGLSIAADSEKAAPAEKACCAQAAAASCGSAEGKACCSAEAKSCCAGGSGCSLASEVKTGCSSGGGCPLTALLGMAGSAEAGCSSGGCSDAAACSNQGCPLQAGSASQAVAASGNCCASKGPAIVCPVSGEAASKEVKVAFNGGDVYLRCAGCKAKFEKDPQKYAAKANHQLVSTGQAVQVACPVSGGKVNKDVKLKVAGVDVAFFCGGCRAEVAEAKADQQVQLVFGNEAFKKSYKIKKQPPKTEQAKKQQPEQQANKQQPEKNEKKS